MIEAIRSASDILISIDTTHARVAEAAIEAGANAINDVSAGVEDPGLIEVAARLGCGLILMHRLVPPGQDSYSTAYDQPPIYENVVLEVRAFLQDRARLAREVGVGEASIVLDPGLGFGKSVDQNWALIRETHSPHGGWVPASRGGIPEVLSGGDLRRYGGALQLDVDQLRWPLPRCSTWAVSAFSGCMMSLCMPRGWVSFIASRARREDTAGLLSCFFPHFTLTHLIWRSDRGIRRCTDFHRRGIPSRRS